MSALTTVVATSIISTSLVMYLAKPATSLAIVCIGNFVSASLILSSDTLEEKSALCIVTSAMYVVSTGFFVFSPIAALCGFVVILFTLSAVHYAENETIHISLFALLACAYAAGALFLAAPPKKM